MDKQKGVNIEVKIKSGYDGDTVFVAIEAEGEIKSQIAFPVGMEAVIAEAVLMTARTARENKGKIIKPEMKLIGGKQ